MAFGKKKDSEAASTDGATSEPGAAPPAGAVKKSKSFKRIRGLLKGNKKSRKSSRKAAAAKGAAGGGGDQNSAPPDGDDLSTIYGVDVEERSVMTQQTSFTSNNNNKGDSSDAAGGGGETKGEDGKKQPPPQAYILKVVLLLMDPETRRFELLQLEFDSLKALVSDVLAQIPVSVTEEALRLQKYTGIAGKDGVEMAPSKLLADFCQGNEVLVAIPEGVPAKECARLARPILSDEKVVNMLASSGIDAKGWKEEHKKKKKKSALKTASRSAPESAAEPLDAPQSGSNSKVFTVVAVVLIALLLQVFHVYVSAPIKPGSTISPGIWLSKCGLLTVLPSCKNAYMHFNREGVVTHYNAKKEKTWQMEGEICEEDDCVQGMEFTESGKVIIGGKPVGYVTSFVKDAELSPWPFVTTPKLKVWRK